MFFERKIKYLEYRINDERICGAGFVKLEARDTLCSLQLNISGLSGIISGIGSRYAVMLKSGTKEVEFATIELSQEKVCCEFSNMQMENMNGTEITYQNLEAIRIVLSPGREIYCAVREPERSLLKQEEKPMQVKEYEIQADASRQVPGSQAEEEIFTWEQDDKPEEEILTQGQVYKPEEKMLTQEQVYKPEEKKLTQEQVYEPEEEMLTQEQVYEAEEKKLTQGKVYEPEEEIPTQEQDYGMQEETFMQEEMDEVEEGIFTQEQNMERRERKISQERVLRVERERQHQEQSQRMQESKWNQLSAIYPHINPFQDEREYLSISPRDFVILSEKYYRLIHNSFLLHGYYNYRHLILQRLERRGEVKYYIGVPGNFFDKEKQVAIMFGFESFECLDEPARSGDYGYYMMRVEI